MIDELRELNKDDYTSASYDILSQAIAKAEKDMSKGDAELDKANIAAMREAQKALVSIVDLKAAIAESENTTQRIIQQTVIKYCRMLLRQRKH